jgi:[glutamine synthetase] adenylyltransferase / [glutamine synthetase]-adenylyl-L-tyrosine phosphorylase
MIVFLIYIKQKLMPHLRYRSKIPCSLYLSWTESLIDFNLENIPQWQTLTNLLAENATSAKLRLQMEKLVMASSFAMAQLIRFPDLINKLDNTEIFCLELDLLDENLRNQTDIDVIKKHLRQYRNRKLTEIIFFDVVLQQPLQDILTYLSDLADALIARSLSTAEVILSRKHGQPFDEDGNPLQLNIIAMGKLGGRELNFSSDIDLICSFANDGELSGYGHLSYQEYFQRVVRLFSKILADNTEDGFVYRVDLRLRPWGDSGPVALSHAAVEHYYQLHGRDWEQYAMVKARILSGSENDKAYLQSIIKPFVYRKYHDYRVFEGLAGLKDKIDMQARSKKMELNIKVGTGGIREIEFFIQAFQILKGGRNHNLQQPGIFNCFSNFPEHKIVPEETVMELLKAYCFLRLLENRIQMVDDEQTHLLPTNKNSRTRIARSMNFNHWDDVEEILKQHRINVARHFNELFKKDAGNSDSNSPFSGGDSISDESTEEHQLEFIRAMGLPQPEDINQQLLNFYRSKEWGFMSAKAKQRFNTLLPELLRTLIPGRQPNVLFARLLKLFASIAGRSVYFEFLYQNQPLLGKISNLFDLSEWIADEVSSFPMLLENLFSSGSLEDRFSKIILQDNLSRQLLNVSGDQELELDTLRLFKREQTLEIATAELAHEISTIDVSHYLSDLAEVVLDAIYRLASNMLEIKHGEPQYKIDKQIKTANFAIIGYGKLGGQELHYQSDLDVIFLHDSQGSNQQTSGPKVIENSMYFARLAQKIISMTHVLTSAGKLYEIDSRLRPDGASGLLVSTIAAFALYQQEKAWTWEHQALVRARLVAGNQGLKLLFENIKRDILALPRQIDELAREIIDMREKMVEANHSPETERVNLKHSRGGMIDIEFMVQFWVLLHANNIGSIYSYSDNISLIRVLLQKNLIDGSFESLIEIYQSYHRLLHETVLQNRPAEIDSEVIINQLKQVKTCWNSCFSLP